MGKLVKEHGFKPSVAKAKIRNEIQERYPSDNLAALQTLPSAKSMTQVFSRKRKFLTVENFNPLAPPEKFFVKF